MDKAFHATLERILGPLATRHLRPLADDDAAPTPFGDQGFNAISAYQHAIASRNFVAAFAIRERLKTLEIETLLTLAQSHAVSRRASSVRPLIDVQAETLAVRRTAMSRHLRAPQAGPNPQARRRNP